MLRKQATTTAIESTIDIHSSLFTASKINFAERTEDGVIKVKQLTPEELVKVTGQQFIWSESLVMEKSDIKTRPALGTEFPAFDDNKTGLGHFIMGAIAKNRNKLAVSYINPVIGYGVIALEDLPANTSIIHYAGKYVPVKEKQPIENPLSAYSVRIDNSNNEMVGIIYAEKYRNIAGFLQHLPSEEDYRFEKSVSMRQIAFANLHANLATYDNYPLVIFRTNERISRGSCLGFDYGPSYFFTLKMTARLCYITGKLVDQSLYATTKVKIKIYFNNNKLGSFDYETERDSLEKKFKTGPLLVRSDDFAEIVVVTKEEYDKAMTKSQDSCTVVIRKQDQVSNSNDIPSRHSGLLVTAKGDAHELLTKQICVYLERKPQAPFQPFLSSIKEKEYAQALRRVSTFRLHNDALALAKFLLDLKEKLNININERAGAENLSAYDYAKKQNNQALCEILISHGAEASNAIQDLIKLDIQVDASGETAINFKGVRR